MSQFTFHTPANTQGETKALLEDIERQYGFIPNLFAYMAESPITIEAYLSLNKLLAKSAFSPAQQQVALLAASIENRCDYCTAAHRALGKLNKAKQQTLDALHNGDVIEDASDRSLAEFVKQVVAQRGHLNRGEVAEFIAAGFSQRHVLEVVLMVTIKTLSNYINHLTMPEVNQELKQIV